MLGRNTNRKCVVTITLCGRGRRNDVIRLPIEPGSGNRAKRYAVSIRVGSGGGEVRALGYAAKEIGCAALVGNLHALP